jgi:hypothetical protein
MNKSIVALVIGLSLVACGKNVPTGDEIMNKQQRQMDRQAALSVGPPAIVNFQEKRFLKQIYELRDTQLSTTTYIVDRYGRTHKICDSVGYGIPYATEYTNPSKIDYNGGSAGGGNVTVPQADPNGLFSPASAEGTWVLCLDPKSKNVVPLYIEPRIIVSPFALNIK